MKATTIAVLATALFAVAQCDKKGTYLNDALQTQADRAKRHGYGGHGGGLVQGGHGGGIVHGGHGGHHGGLGYGTGVSSLGSSSLEHGGGAVGGGYGAGAVGGGFGGGAVGGGYGGAVGGFGGHAGGHAGHGTLYRSYVERPRFEYSRGFAKSTSSGIVNGQPSPAKYTYGGSFVGQPQYRPQYYYRPSHSVYQQQSGYGASNIGAVGHAGRGFGGHGGLASVSYGHNNFGHTGGHLGGYGGSVVGGAIGGGYGGHAGDSVEAGYGAGAGHGHGHSGLVGGSHAVGGGYGIGGGFGGSSVGHHGGSY